MDDHCYILIFFLLLLFFLLFFFFFNDTATTEIYTLSLHDALPISRVLPRRRRHPAPPVRRPRVPAPDRRRAARLVSALLRNRAAAADEHGGAVRAGASPLRGAAARERLGPLLHVAPLRHPRVQPVRPDHVQPRRGARRATRLRLVHEPRRLADLLARRRRGEP